MTTATREGTELVPDLTNLKLKWWQYLIIAGAAMGIDIVAHINALGFAGDGSAVSAVAIPIASAALIAMSALPAVVNAKNAVESNRGAINDVHDIVTKIDAQTNGVLEQRIKAGAVAALAEHFGTTDDKAITNDITAVVDDVIKPGA